MTKVAIYARVSQHSQTVENQFQELQAVAQRQGWTVVAIFTDEGFSGAKGRDQRPGFDALLLVASQALAMDVRPPRSLIVRTGSR